MNLNYDLLPKADRQKIREAMIDEMEAILAHDGPRCTRTKRRLAAVKLVNQALSRERAKHTKETVCQELQ